MCYINRTVDTRYTTFATYWYAYATLLMEYVWRCCFWVTWTKGFVVWGYEFYDIQECSLFSLSIRFPAIPCKKLLLYFLLFNSYAVQWQYQCYFVGLLIYKNKSLNMPRQSHIFLNLEFLQNKLNNYAYHKYTKFSLLLEYSPENSARWSEALSKTTSYPRTLNAQQIILFF